MSAQFPNVPDVPGVPNVNRPDALIKAVQSNAATALNGTTIALPALVQGDTATAIPALTSASAAASAGAQIAGDIYSSGSNVVGGLTGAAANANSALSAIASGDINGAIASAELALDAAERAYTTISEIINPTPIEPLDGSGGEVNAETALQWGLYTLEGELAVQVDNVVAFENALEARISDYPVENGGFGSYNKVIVPYDIRLMVTRGGSVEDRQETLKAAQDAWQSTTLYNMVTPECVYLDVNLVTLRRIASADHGVGLMPLELGLRKVRQTATLAFSSTKEPTGQQTVNNGSVQTRQTTDTQQYAGTGQ